MSRRTDLIKQLLGSKKFGKEKEQEQQFLTATAELILHDLVNIAINGLEREGPGSLVINLMNDSTTYMSGDSVETDIVTAERLEDEEVLKMLRGLIEKIETNDWSKYVLITLISDAGTRTFAIEAGGCQESFRALAEEFSG
tara:strand:- start:3961 stop:4383 length:423 start_codon:yes stop_codon:yes gene_type:complete